MIGAVVPCEPSGAIEPVARPYPVTRQARLVMVIGSLEGGGAERQMSGMANYWAGRSVAVTLATWSGSGIADFYRLDDRVRRVHLGLPTGGGPFPALRASAARLAALRELLRHERPDAVLSFVTESNVLTLLARFGMKVRVVVSERVYPALHTTLPWKWKLLRRVVYGWSDVVVAQTQATAAWLSTNCRIKALVIPNSLHPLPSPSVDRQPLILAVGRLVEQKGFDLLLRAFARTVSNFRHWRVVIIGEGSERARLMRLCDDLKISAQVTFAGRLSDVETWMARAAIVVQPSRFEGFPNVVLESMGMGAAVISCDCMSGPADLIEDGINGRLVPVDDVNSLSRAMAELMSQPELRMRLSAEALKVRQRYHQDIVMAQWETCLFGANVAVIPDTSAEPVDCG